MISRRSHTLAEPRVGLDLAMDSQGFFSCEDLRAVDISAILR